MSEITIIAPEPGSTEITLVLGPVSGPPGPPGSGGGGTTDAVARAAAAAAQGDIDDHAAETATAHGLGAALAGKAAASHTHPASDVASGVLAPARLGSGTPGAGKYVDGGTGAWTDLPSGGSVAWGDVTGKPTEFPPEDHEHVIADVTGLQDALDAKAPVGTVGSVIDLTADDGPSVEADLSGIDDDVVSQTVLLHPDVTAVSVVMPTATAAGRSIVLTLLGASTFSAQVDGTATSITSHSTSVASCHLVVVDVGGTFVWGPADYNLSVLAEQVTGAMTPGQIGTGTPAAGKYVDGGTGTWTDLPAGGSSVSDFYEDNIYSGLLGLQHVAMGGGGALAGVWGANSLVCWKIMPVTDVQVDGYMFTVGADGGSGKVGRLGIYPPSATPALTGAPLIDTGSISVNHAAGTVVTGTFSAVSLSALNTYFAAWVTDSTTFDFRYAATGVANTVRANAIDSMQAGSASHTLLRMAHTYGALPTSPSMSWWTSFASLPGVLWRVQV